MIVIYHNKDLDGFTSGALIKMKYPEAKMIGYDYGDTFNCDITGEEIIMVDISFPMEIMLKLAKNNKKLTWIDHHISAINDYEKFILEHGTFCNAVLENGIAACEGTWKYLFPNENIPLAVRLLGEYDTWRNQDKDRWNDKILPFQFGMKINCNSVETFPINILDNEDFVYTTIERGKLILRYQDQQNELLCKRTAFECEFEGLRAICLNGGGFNSDVFKSVYDENNHDIMIPFQFNGKTWDFSLYTTKDDVDCSIIAKSKGGGGHKKAAGFRVEKLKTIFKFIPDNCSIEDLREAFESGQEQGISKTMFEEGSSKYRDFMDLTFEKFIKDLNKQKMKQCKKQTTVAIIMKDQQFISIGFNEILSDIDECPRKNMETGVGYELCKNICKQENHAEVNACINAGEKANGSTLYLIGHTYCCDNCKKIMKECGIKEIKIL